MNAFKRGILIILSIILLILLLVSSDWVPAIRLIHNAQSAINRGDISAAAVMLANAKNISLDRYTLLETAGIMAYEAGKTKSAHSILMEVHSVNLLSPQGMKILGDIASQQGDNEAATKFWINAVAIEEDPEIYANLVQVYRDAGDWNNEIRYQRDLSALIPNNADANYQLGLMLAASQPESALAYLTLASELDQTLMDARSMARNIRSAINRGDSAYPFIIAGQELAALGERELSLLAFFNATQENPEYAEAWAYLGEMLQQTGQKGYNELDKAINLDPDSTAVNTLYALYWQRQERYDLALVYLYAAKENDADNPALQAEIGNTLALMGNLPAAEHHYQLAANMNPGNPTYWNSLANYYIKYEVEIKGKAAEAARKAVLLNPEDPVSLDILAQIYLLQDHPSIAQRFLNRALSADGEYAPAHLHTGLANIVFGERLIAYQHFKMALEYSRPSSVIYDQAKRLLETYYP